ncbi:MAG: hypothetical protein IJS32_08645 [Kiritimatiellae bacterium]|nr:hypothetical protein [Kiritimatiellia bacterium]
MSGEQQKSVPAIAEEMRSAANRYRIVDSLMLGMFAERLDAAWKRDILVEAKRNQDVVDGLTDECDRLREALEEVDKVLHGDNPFGVRAHADMCLVVSAALSADEARRDEAARQDAAPPEGGGHAQA